MLEAAQPAASAHMPMTVRMPCVIHRRTGETESASLSVIRLSRVLLRRLDPPRTRAIEHDDTVCISCHTQIGREEIELVPPVVGDVRAAHEHVPFILIDAVLPLRFADPPSFRGAMWSAPVPNRRSARSWL